MTNHTEINISKVEDPDFQSMIAELCQCLNFGTAEFQDKKLSFIFMVMVQDGKSLAGSDVSASKILGRKVGTLAPDTVVYQVCQELADKIQTDIESHAKKTILSLINHSYKSYSPPPSRLETPSLAQIRYAEKTRVIKLRRKNSGL